MARDSETPRRTETEWQKRCKAMKDMLSDVVAQHAFFIVPFVRLTNDVFAGMFLSRFFYWADKGKDPDGWIYKEQEEIRDECGLSPKQQKNARKKLLKLGLIEEKRMGANPRLYYRIDIERLIDLAVGDRETPVWRSTAHMRKQVETMAEYASDTPDDDCCDEGIFDDGDDDGDGDFEPAARVVIGSESPDLPLGDQEENAKKLISHSEITDLPFGDQLISHSEISTIYTDLTAFVTTEATRPKNAATKSSAKSSAKPKSSLKDEAPEITTPQAERAADVFFNSGFGTLSLTLADILHELIEEYSEPWVCDAIKTAAKNGAKNLKYVEAILTRRSSTGYEGEEEKAIEVDTKPEEWCEAAKMVLEAQKLQKVAKRLQLDSFQAQELADAKIDQIEVFKKVLTKGLRGRWKFTNINWMIDQYKMDTGQNAPVDHRKAAQEAEDARIAEKARLLGADRIVASIAPTQAARRELMRKQHEERQAAERAKQTA